MEGWKNGMGFRRKHFCMGEHTIKIIINYLYIVAFARGSVMQCKWVGLISSLYVHIHTVACTSDL